MPTPERPRAFTKALIFTILTLTCLTINPELEPQFRDSTQTRSFVVDLQSFHPVPNEPTQSWVVTPDAVALISLTSGDVIRKILLKSTVSCHHSPSARNHMLYSLDRENRKLYGLSLSSGRVEKDLRLPIFEGEDWLKSLKSMDCLEEGLELGFGEDKFVFYKNYSQEQVLLSEESVVLNKKSNSEISKKEIYTLAWDKKQNSKFFN